jgi:hypothetical protein
LGVADAVLAGPVDADLATGAPVVVQALPATAEALTLALVVAVMLLQVPLNLRLLFVQGATFRVRQLAPVGPEQ